MRRSPQFAVAAAFAAQRAKPTPAPNVSHFTLANGLEVVVIPDRRTPVVTHMIWYKVGSADEPPGKSGIAHFLEHLMFKGTAKNPAGQFSQTVAPIGGQENAFTSTDYTGYFQRVSRDHLTTLMEFEADRMTGLVLTDDSRAARAATSCSKSRTSASPTIPARALGEQVEAALYLNHPYGRPVIGWRHEIETAQPRGRARVLQALLHAQQRRRWWSPATSRAEEVKALAEETYGKVEPARRDRAARVRPQEPPQVAPRHGHARRSARRSSRACSAAISCRRPRPRKPGEAEALEVLAHILGSGTNSRLYRTLVVETAARDQRRRLVPGHGARRARASASTRTPQPGRHAAAARRGDRRGDRRADRRERRHAPRSSSAPRPG